MKKLMSMLICFAAGFSMTAAPLTPGVQAPELQIKDWAKGGPVSIAAGKGKNIYVIEFWATWCPPCRMSIPHLSKLQKEYKDKGLVVVGITKEDLAVVKKFVAAQTDMNYNVAVDTEGTTYSTYMDGVRGIPHAFIVDKEGRIAWTGHPMEMDSVIEHIMQGDYNPENSKKIRELVQKLQSSRDMHTAIETAEEILVLDPNHDIASQAFSYVARQPKEKEAALKFIDDLIKAQPDKSRPYFIKLQLLAGTDSNADIKNTMNQYISQFKNNASKLNTISWYILDEMPFGSPYLKEALEAAELSVKQTDPSDKKITAGHMDTLARCYYAMGRIELAIEEQGEAVNLLKGTKEEKSFAKKLNFYKEAFELGKSIRKGGE